MDVSINEMAERLSRGKAFRLFCHVRPDGDTICSAYSLASALIGMGKQAEVITEGNIPSAYIPYIERVGCTHADNALNIAIDSATPARLGKSGDLLFDFSIDHHTPNTINARYKYTEGESSSCGEIILKLLLAMNAEITPLIADMLYIAVITDTFCFRSVSVNAGTLEAAAKLAAYGADVSGLARLNFMNKTPQRLKIEAVFTDSLRYSCGGKVVCGILTRDDMRSAGIEPHELEGITSIAEQVRGAVIGVTIRETAEGTSRVSVHTMHNIPEIDASAICRELGDGGGHFHAAGCEIPAPPYEAVLRVEEVCARYIG